MMKAIRFTLAVLIAFAGTPISPPEPAQAFLFSGATASSPPPSGQVTTFDVVNASSSSQGSNFVTQIFGHPFKKGDIANGCSGGAPIFQLVGGTNVPFSEGLNPVCWVDGSLKWAPFMLKVPASIGGRYSIASSGSSYNSGTGVIVIATSSTPTGITTGSRVNLDGLTGTGNWGAITGTYTVASVSGSNITINGQSGYGSMTITGGTVSQAITINILSGGTTPSVSGRSTSDYTAGGLDLNVKVTGLSNLSGTYVSDLVKALSDNNADNYQYMDGGAGRVDRIRECFRLTNTSGSCHGQLEGYFYLTATNDGSGNLGGIRWTHRTTQPWYDQTGNSYRTFSAWATYNGASQTKNVMGSNFGVPTAFDWYSGDGVFKAPGAIAGGNFAIQVSNSGGSLPTGLSAGTDYFVYQNNATQATWFNLLTGTSTGSSVFPSSACTGTCSYTASPYIPPFGSIFTTNADGSDDYIQGNGSVSADSTVRITLNPIYIRSTKMVPPYALGQVPVTPYANIMSGATGGGASPTLVGTYLPDSAGAIFTGGSGVNSTGESDWIGPEPTWVASHVFLQDAADETLIRAMSLEGAAMEVMLLNSSTHTIPVANSGSYSGMPTADTSILWSASTVQGNSGIQLPANSAVWGGPFYIYDYSHYPELDYYACLTFGNPEYCENLQNNANSAILNHIGWPADGTAQSAVITSQNNAMGGFASNGPSSRNITVNGVTYRGISSEFGDLVRQEAWTVRTVGLAAALGGLYGPSASSVTAYLHDIMVAQYGAESAYIGLLPAYAQSIGTFNEAISGATGMSQSWARGYLMMATSYVNSVFDSPSWGQLTLGNHMAKFWKFVDDNFGVWTIPSYNDLQRDVELYGTPSAGSQDYGPYLTAKENYAICDFYGQSWTDSGGSPASTFTDTVFPTNYVETNGDTVRWFGTPYGGTNVPAALTSFGSNSGYFYTFYKVNVNDGAKSFQLAATLGGSPIAMSNSGTDNACEGPFGMKSFTTTSINSSPLGNGYMQNETGALNWWAATGGTVDAATKSDMQGNLSALGGYIPNSPKYYFVDHFFLPQRTANDNWEPKLLQRLAG